MSQKRGRWWYTIYVHFLCPQKDLFLSGPSTNLFFSCSQVSFGIWNVQVLSHKTISQVLREHAVGMPAAAMSTRAVSPWPEWSFHHHKTIQLQTTCSHARPRTSTSARPARRSPESSPLESRCLNIGLDNSCERAGQEIHVWLLR